MAARGNSLLEAGNGCECAHAQGTSERTNRSGDDLLRQIFNSGTWCVLAHRSDPFAQGSGSRVGFAVANDLVVAGLKDKVVLPRLVRPCLKLG